MARNKARIAKVSHATRAHHPRLARTRTQAVPKPPAAFYLAPEGSTEEQMWAVRTHTCPESDSKAATTLASQGLLEAVRKRKGRVLFAGVYGSRRYNLHSDVPG